MRIRYGLAAALLLTAFPCAPVRADDDGFKPIFDGKTLEGWNGDPKFWSVEDGAITGRTTAENPTKGNTFIVWNGEVGDFELELDYKIVAGNSGIQYRSFRLKNGADEWRIGGYQADIDSKETYSGIVYGEQARGILVGRGESGTIDENGKKSAERFAPSADIQAKIKNEDWNHYRIVAEGNHLVQFINGVKTAELVDNDAEGQGKRMAKGLLALQLHQGPPMVVQFKNVKLKRLGEEKKEAAGLRIRIDPKGRIALGGNVVDDLSTELRKVAREIREQGVVIEADRRTKLAHVQGAIEACQECGVEKFTLKASQEGVSLETSKARVDLYPDGTLDGHVDSRIGRVGVGVRDGKVQLSLGGIPIATFGETAEPDAPADVTEPALGDEGTFDLEGTSTAPIGKSFVAAKAETKKVVFVAGPKSHGYGAHEHKAGCMLLADQLEKSGLPIETEVVTEGWPRDTSVFDGADCIVVYADGGGRHPFNAHLDELNKLTANGVGIVCIHYGVEVPKGPSGEAFLEWTGGYFETDWSVNPHWDADFAKLPEHATTRGVQPFKVNDEWYYHMRFREEMQGVTPILTDLPPKSTLVKADGSLARPDNAHNNNPHVRKAVLERMEPQHVAWAREREDGGRGFGITGGHFHWNWGNDQMRKLMLNAIVWSAGAEVPEKGVPTQPVSVEALMANQDEPVPDNFNPGRIGALLEQWNR